MYARALARGAGDILFAIESVSAGKHRLCWTACTQYAYCYREIHTQMYMNKIRNSSNSYRIRHSQQSALCAHTHTHTQWKFLFESALMENVFFVRVIALAGASAQRFIDVAAATIAVG